MNRLPKWIAISFLGIALILILASIATRTPWWDEGSYADPAVSLATKGTFTSTVVGEYTLAHFPRLREYTYWVPPYYPGGLAIAFKVLGVSVWAMRIYSFFWALVALGSWYLIGRQLGGSQSTGFLAAAILALDYAFIQLAANGRPDAMILGCGSIGLALYLTWREENLTRALLAGWTFISLAVCTHPSGGVLACDLVLLVAMLDLKRLRPVHFLCAAAPFLIVVSVWVIYVLQAPDVFRDQFLNEIRFRAQGNGSRVAKIFTDVYDRYFMYYGRGSGPERLKIFNLIFYLAGFLAVLFNSRLRAKPSVRIALALAVLNYVVLSILDRQAFPHYTIHVLVAFMLVCAIWLADALEMPGFAMRWVALGLMAASAAVTIGGHGMKIRNNGYRNEYLPIVDRIKPIIDRGGNVIAGSEFAFAVGYRSNIVDDVRLGSQLAVPPEAIVFNLYDLRESAWGEQATRAGFHKVMENKNFVLYEPVAAQPR